jgi:hypothetical protein
VDRIKLKINITSNFKTMVRGQGNIKSYLYKCKILDRPMFSCRSGKQTVDHIWFDCKLHEQKRDKLKASVLRPENWPLSKNELINKYNNTYNIFTNFISLEKI